MTGRRWVSWTDEDGAPRCGWEEIYDNSRDHGPVSDERAEALDAALETLTPKQRYVVELSWGLRGENYSFTDLAKAMGVTTQAVHNIYERAMERIRREMA